MIRVAAVADIHYGKDTRGFLDPCVDKLGDEADVFLIAGDLTKTGDPLEAEILAEDIRAANVPMVAVLGNHDHHSGQEDSVRRIVESAGIRVLEGDGLRIDVGDISLGIAGTKGFGGGFIGACATDFGEAEVKSFIRHTKGLAQSLHDSLVSMDTDYRVALLHYSPIEETLRGERLEIYPFLGSYLLAEAIDAAGADLVVHGHAHNGREKGVTSNGIPVRNVSLPVINAAYNVYHLGAEKPSSFRVQEPATSR